MPRKKLTEYKAKSIVFEALGLSYTGINLNEDNYNDVIKTLDKGVGYVVKVDQGVKKRFKQGLIGVNVSKEEIAGYIKKFIEKGFSNFLIEKFEEHKSDEEKYFSIDLTREGTKVLYSLKGGVDIESNPESIKSVNYSDSSAKSIANDLGINEDFIKNLLNVFKDEFFSFLEINPLLIIKDNPLLLDLAVEVDSSAEYFVKGWSGDDLISENLNNKKTKEELNIEELAANSTASFRLNVLNSDGSVFMLLSGGGASISVADEAYQRGFAKELGNYGEYSGNPNEEETYIYAKNVLSLLLKSKAKKKALVIAGGIANFTDVYKTFKGIITALDEVKNEMIKQKIKVFVRRGGPNEVKGLSAMRDFLSKNNLLGKVEGSDYVLTDIIDDTLNFLN